MRVSPRDSSIRIRWQSELRREGVIVANPPYARDLLSPAILETSLVPPRLGTCRHSSPRPITISACALAAR